MKKRKKNGHDIDAKTISGGSGMMGLGIQGEQPADDQAALEWEKNPASRLHRSLRRSKAH